MPDLTFHHVGLAVRSPEAALRFLSMLGYTLGPPVRDVLQNVHLTMCRHPSLPAVEIVAPTEAIGPLAGILARADEMAYHLCYETPDIRQVVQAWRADGVRVTTASMPKPAILFDNRLVAFYHVEGFGLVELLQT